MKTYLEAKDRGLTPESIWFAEDCSTNENAKNGLKELFGGVSVFDTPKPVDLVRHMLQLGTDSSSLVVDFFAGSGTTAHAVMAQNAADGGSRRFILVQLPEVLSPDSKEQSAAASYCDAHSVPRTLAEVTKARVRLAAAQVRSDIPSNASEGDLGFRVLRLDCSNIRTWNADPENLQTTVEEHTEHLLPGRTEQDLLCELLLKLGLDLAVPVETRQIASKAVHNVGAGTLFACLADGISREVAEPLALGIAEWQKSLSPAGGTKLVFKDSAFADDVAKTNLAAILNQHGLDDVRSI